MNSKNIRDSISYNATIKTDEFVSTKLTGLAFLRTGMIVTDFFEEDIQCFEAFPHFVVENLSVSTDTLSDDLVNLAVIESYANHPIVIGCRDQQWSYVLYVLIVLLAGNPPSFELIAYGLQRIIENDKHLENINSNTLNRLARILANYSILNRFDDSIITRENAINESIFLLLHEEYDRQTLMLSLVFEHSLSENTPDWNLVEQTDDVRPPIMPFMDRMVDPIDMMDMQYGDTLQEIDPGRPMADTSGEKPKPFPTMDDCLGITSYSGYEPTPDEEEVRDEMTSERNLQKKFAELKEMMNGYSFNELYARNLLHSGITVEEVLIILTLKV